eukprot:g39235.t1
MAEKECPEFDKPGALNMDDILLRDDFQTAEVIHIGRSLVPTESPQAVHVHNAIGRLHRSGKWALTRSKKSGILSSIAEIAQLQKEAAESSSDSDLEDVVEQDFRPNAFRPPKLVKNKSQTGKSKKKPQVAPGNERHSFWRNWAL